MATNPVKVRLTYSIRDFYNDYKREAKNSKFETRPYIKYRDYIWDIFAEIFKAILHNSWHFVLPYSMGEFYIKKYDKLIGKRAYSKALSYKNKKPTYTFNNHTMRQVFKFVWDKTYASFENKKFYKFNIINGEKALHKKYKVGKKALSDYYFESSTNPKLKLPNGYNKARKFIEEPNYDTNS